MVQIQPDPPNNYNSLLLSDTTCNTCSGCADVFHTTDRVYCSSCRMRICPKCWWASDDQCLDCEEEV